MRHTSDGKRQSCPPAVLHHGIKLVMSSVRPSAAGRRARMRRGAVPLRPSCSERGVCEAGD
jgi:hypothetical protein